MKISVVGSGYVGLVVGTVFAETGNSVICVDSDKKKIEMLQRGHIPIYEPGLEELVKKNIVEKRLEFTISLEHGVCHSDIVFLALPTPPMEDGRADLKYVLDVAEKIGTHANGYKVIVTKSTVPVGTVQRIRDVIAKSCQYPFDVVSNPEFLKEGTAVNDAMKPDRIVVGSSSERAIKFMKELYDPFVRTGNPILIMDERSAELSKYASNAFLATKISFMNELANLSDVLGADVSSVRKAMGADPRIGSQFLFPGVGYGGSCFPKDVKALIQSAAEYDFDFKTLRAVDDVNEKQKKILPFKIKKHFVEGLNRKTITVWGLSFKPRTDDTREAPALVIIRDLVEAGATVRAHDPIANQSFKERYSHALLTFHDNAYEALNHADALMVLTEWNEFRQPDFDRIKRLMRNHVIFDGRNIYEPRTMKELGFTYYSIGRDSVIRRKKH